MARSAIAGIKKSTRKVDTAINKELKKVEAKKAKEAAKKELEGKRKKLADLKKRSR